MRLFLCLLGLALLGAAEVVMPTDFFSIPPSEWFLPSVRLFSAPLALLALQITRQLIVQVATMAWGLWLTLLGISEMMRRNEPVTFPGKLWLFSVMLCSLGVTLFSVMQLIKKPAQRDIDDKTTSRAA